MTVVKPAERSDVEAMLELLEEMDQFYGTTELEPLEVRRQQLTEAVFGEPRAAHVLLAWDDGRATGFATYSFLWPAVGLTRSLYLKELYVAQRRWRAGLGKLLMEAVFDVAAQHDCSRVEWTTDLENAAAQRFYDSLGLRSYPSKVFYRYDGDSWGR